MPEDCDEAIIELSAAIIATAAGTLGTDAALGLDLASGSGFFGGGVLACEHWHLHHKCNLMASDEKCMGFWSFRPASEIFLFPLIFLLVETSPKLSSQQLSEERELQLQQQHRAVLLEQLSQARPVSQPLERTTSLGS